jgi:hypothetical protein
VRDCSWLLQCPDRFENVRPENFECKSDRTDHLPYWGYNCIAWAAGKTDKWWWPISDPGAYWPIPIDPVDPVTLKQFIMAFESQGYSVCRSGRFENGFEKVTIYVDGTGEPTHAARMLETGVWSSKMGRMEDIQHETLQVLEGKAYGSAVAYLKKRNQAFQRPGLLRRLLVRVSTFVSALFPRSTGANPVVPAVLSRSLRRKGVRPEWHLDKAQ